jgi:hypothetical protein
MIVNRQLLELMGVCGESLEHFTNVVGGGDVNFQMGLDDSVHYLRGLEALDPETYRGWADLVDGYKTDPRYVKAAEQYSYGGYVVIGCEDTVYSTVDEAQAVRDRKQAEKYAQEKQRYVDQLYISAVQTTDCGEILHAVTAPTGVDSYIVFNLNTGVHERFDSFEAASARLTEIEHETLDPRCVVRIGRQIMVGGEVAAIDVVEDA